MGPRRCHCRTSNPIQSITSIIHPVPAKILLLLLAVFSLAVTSVSGFSLQKASESQCQINHCWEQFNSAKDALELSAGVAGDDINPLTGSPTGLADPGTVKLDKEAHCVALRTYWNCIKGAKNTSRGCQGNIPYYGIRNGVKNQLKQYNCTMNGPTVDPSKQPPQQPRQIPYQCQYHGKKTFRHCGLFGDPHLRTFTSQFQTCKVKGAWPLVNNKYLIVQVTNDPVLGGAGDATATSKLTVIVKSHPECGSNHYHTYQAQTDELPSAFEDGNTVYGPHGSVQLVEVEANQHVEIHVHYIATTIIIRQIGRYFTFAIHMPEQLIQDSKDLPEPELCTKGCPVSEQINYKQYLAERKDRVTRIQSEATGTLITMTRSEAEEVCHDSGLVDFYFDSCVFDLMATGDKNFTIAAISAQKDLVRLDPSMAMLTNRTTLDLYDEMFSAATALSWTVSVWWHVVCVMSVLLTLLQRDVIHVR